MTMVPKGPRAEAKKVRDIDSAPSRQGGRPSGLGYDPSLEREHQTSPTTEETDVFKTIGHRGYSEDRFYTKSTNEHNHGEKFQVRVPQGIDSQIHAAVREVPEYRHVNDMVRDALVHRLEYIQKRYKITPEAQRFLELERLRADSDRRAADIALMQETVADIAGKLQQAWEAADYGVLAKELVEADELIDWLRAPYQGQVQQLLRDWTDRSRAKIEEYNARHED